jgi:hypothetical protein
MSGSRAERPILSKLQERFPKTDIGLGVPFAISLPLFLFRSDPQSSLLFRSSAAGSSLEADSLGTRKNSWDLYGTLIP